MHERFKWNTSELRVTQLVDNHLQQSLTYLLSRFHTFILSVWDRGCFRCMATDGGVEGDISIFLGQYFPKKNYRNEKRNMAVAHLLHLRSVNMFRSFTLHHPEGTSKNSGSCEGFRSL